MLLSRCFLTNKISPTIAQFKFNDRTPQNMSRKASHMLACTTIMAPMIKGKLKNKPKAQIKGSQRGKRFFNRCDNIEPNGTPTIPETNVIPPNISDTLKG